MIARDGAQISLWQDIPFYKPDHKIPDAGAYDVAIIGGGVTGITTAWLLQKEGKRCILFEAKTLCYGTTGGTTAHLNTLLDTPYPTIIKNFGKNKARLVAQAAAESIEFIKSNVESLSIECGFEETTAHLFSQNKKQTTELEEIFDACTDVGLEVSYGFQNPTGIPFEKIIEVKGQAKFHPTLYVHALAKDFEKHGGLIIQNCRVTNIQEEENIVTLETENESGLYQAVSVFYATHIPPGVNLLHLRCAPYRSYAMAFKLNDGRYPEGLSYDMIDPYHYYRTQIVDGQQYLIAGGEDHKTGHEENTDARFEKIEAHVRAHFNVEAVSNKWSSQYFEPVDGLPYIGHLPGFSKRIYVATGYSGNGMIFSAVAAKVISDLILNREGKYEKLFSPERIKLVSGFSDFVKNNADVVKHLVIKWFSAEEITELGDLKLGEGKVIKSSQGMVALSKSFTGVLSAVSPVCTHMKCNVQWNKIRTILGLPMSRRQVFP